MGTMTDDRAWTRGDDRCHSMGTMTESGDDDRRQSMGTMTDDGMGTMTDDIVWAR